MPKKTTDLLVSVEEAIWQGDQHTASLLLHKILLQDFTNPQAWQMLHSLRGGEQPFAEFQQTFAQKYYPHLAHLLRQPARVEPAKQEEISESSAVQPLKAVLLPAEPAPQSDEPQPLPAKPEPQSVEPQPPSEAKPLAVAPEPSRGEAPPLPLELAALLQQADADLQQPAPLSLEPESTWGEPETQLAQPEPLPDEPFAPSEQPDLPAAEPEAAAQDLEELTAWLDALPADADLFSSTAEKPEELDLYPEQPGSRLPAPEVKPFSREPEWKPPQPLSAQEEINVLELEQLLNRSAAQPGSAWRPEARPAKAQRSPYCPNCRKLFEPDVLFCDVCGAPLFQMVEALPSEDQLQQAAAKRQLDDTQPLNLQTELGQSGAAAAQLGSPDQASSGEGTLLLYCLSSASGRGQGFRVCIDGKPQAEELKPRLKRRFKLPAGKHKLSVRLNNEASETVTVDLIPAGRAYAVCQAARTVDLKILPAVKMVSLDELQRLRRRSRQQPRRLRRLLMFLLLILVLVEIGVLAYIMNEVGLLEQLLNLVGL